LLRTVAAVGWRRAAKSPVTLLLQVETYDLLQQRAEEHAGAHGVTRTDMVWGELVARHIAESLEEAYLISPPEENVAPMGVNLTMLVVSVSSDVAKQLRGQAGEAARRLTVEDPDVLEEFEWHQIGHTLEKAYLAPHGAGADRPDATPIVDSGGGRDSFAG